MKKKYTGELAKPLKEIRWERVGLEPTAEEAKQIIAAATAEEKAKIVLLFDHYEIDKTHPEAFALLACSLARAHVPGFKRIRKGGPPITWAETDYYELKITIDDFRAKPDSTVKSIAGACRIVAKQEPWKSRGRKLKNPGEALRRAYYKADPDWTRLYRAAGFHLLKSKP